MADGYTMDPAKGSQQLSKQQIAVFHMLWDASHDPCCVMDNAGRFIYANDAYLCTLGFPPDAAVSGHMESYISTLFNNSVDAISGNHINAYDLVCSETNFVAKVSNEKSRKVKYFHFYKKPIIHRNGEILGVCLYGCNDFILSLNMFSKGECVAKVKTLAPSYVFTQRQWEVVYFLQQGYKSSEIAGILGASQKTINNHISHIYKKVSVKGYSEFISFCKKRDLLNYIPEKMQQCIHR